MSTRVDEREAALRVALVELAAVLARLAADGYTGELAIRMSGGVVTGYRATTVADRVALRARAGLPPLPGGRRR